MECVQVHWKPWSHIGIDRKVIFPILRLGWNSVQSVLLRIMYIFDKGSFQFFH